MTEIDRKARYALHPLTLVYDDPNVEQAYHRHYPTALNRTLKPITILLVPFLALLGLLDLTSPFDTLINWPSCFFLSGVVLLLYATARFFGHYIEQGLVATLIAFEVAILGHVETSGDFPEYFPGVLVILMLTPFCGVRFVHGQVATVALIAILWEEMWRKGIDLNLLAHGMVFLIPGVFITAAGGHTIDRQRRRLFAQLRLLEEERTDHEKMALHDALTDLPNRNLLKERMEQSLARARRQHGQFAVLFVDLDDFKSVNDSYGHGIGDQVLKQIAENLRDSVRGEDTVARLGGDEFVVLSEHVNDEHGAQMAADRIQTAVATPIVLEIKKRGDKIHIHVTCSIGIALCPRDGESLDQLIGRADDAMYTAKRGGKSTSRFFRNDEPEVE